MCSDFQDLVDVMRSENKQKRVFDMPIRVRARHSATQGLRVIQCEMFRALLRVGHHNTALTVCCSNAAGSLPIVQTFRNNGHILPTGGTVRNSSDTPPI